jgi:hypothetical protein
MQRSLEVEYPGIQVLIRPNQIWCFEFGKIRPWSSEPSKMPIRECPSITRKQPADIKTLGYNLLPGALIEIDGEEFKVARMGAKDNLCATTQSGE